jgi:alkylhydroperoxidase family enzyme
MAFLPIPPADDLSDEARSARAQLLESRGRVSNVRAALLGHVPSFRAYLEWYNLKDELVPVVGEVGVSLLSYAISDENGDTACSLFFRQVLEGAGEDPDAARTGRDGLLVEFGRQLARNPHALADELYERIAAAFPPEQRVQLVAFAGLVVAINVVNTVGRVPVDDELHPLRDAEPELAMDSLETGAE